MTYIPNEQDTRMWIMLFTHKSSRSLGDMANNGCDKMVHGYGYENFVSLVDKMIADILLIQQKDGRVVLSPKGIFEVTDKIFIPFRNLLAADNIDDLIERLKKSCNDTKIIPILRDQHQREAQEITIKRYAINKLDIILHTMLPAIINILKTAPSS